MNLLGDFCIFLQEYEVPLEDKCVEDHALLLYLNGHHLFVKYYFFFRNDSFVTHWLMWPMFVWQMRLNFLVFSYFLYLFGFVLPLSFSLCTIIFIRALTLPVFLISPSSALFATMFGVRFLSRNICVVCTFVYFWSVNYEESWPFNSLLITV